MRKQVNRVPDNMFITWLETKEEFVLVFTDCQLKMLNNFKLNNVYNMVYGSVLKFVNRVRGLVFNTTFNNISAILWWSVLWVDETELLGENHWPAASHWQTLSHTVVSSTPHHEVDLNSQL